MTVVLDSSALIAVLEDARGADIVEAVLDQSIMSAVNLAEVATKMVSRGSLFTDLEDVIWSTAVEVIDFSDSAAFDCARLWTLGRPRGLSLGDRACLALARTYGVEAYTADRAWAALDLGVAVRLIR
jgi:PIN domain nuclease of toxin-antitoxin system